MSLLLIISAWLTLLSVRMAARILASTFLPIRTEIREIAGTDLSFDPLRGNINIVWFKGNAGSSKLPLHIRPSRGDLCLVQERLLLGIPVRTDVLKITASEPVQNEDLAPRCEQKWG